MFLVSQQNGALKSFGNITDVYWYNRTKFEPYDQTFLWEIRGTIFVRTNYI